MCLFLSGDMNIGILFRTFCASLRHVCFINYPLLRKTVILNIIVEFERNTTFLFGLWADFAQMSIGQVSSNTPFWSAINETVLDQVWLVNILDRTGIFPYRSGKRIQPRPALLQTSQSSDARSRAVRRDPVRAGRPPADPVPPTRSAAVIRPVIAHLRIVADTL